MIPREIEPRHIIAAAELIDAKGVPSMRASRHFDVVVKGKPYPPKYLLSVASRLAAVPELAPGGFITTEARHALGRLGFKLIEKKRARRPSSRVPITVATPSFVVCWADVTCRDVVPLSWLLEGPPLIGVEHEMRDSSARLTGRAKCDVTVTEGEASLDYRPYRSVNDLNKIDDGVVRVAFTAGEPSIVSSVEWRSVGLPRKVVRGVVETPITLTAEPTPYVRPTKTTEKTAALKRERPGQSQFRNALKGIYGGRCCISLCGVSEALEGAHIDSYRSPASNHLCNGLLLRRDLHALFDRHLISVDPQTRQVAVAKRLHGTEYEHFHGHTLPSAELAPDPAALKRHFAVFKKKDL